MRQIFQNHFTDRSGNIISDGTVTVFNANTTVLSTIYSSSGASTAVTNSVLTTGADGFFSFWVDTADYNPMSRFKLILSKTDFTSKTYDDIRIFPAINNNSTGTIYFHGFNQGSTRVTATGVVTGFTQDASSSTKFASSSSTFTGNYGTTAYTIGDVVKALKKHGLMAT